jgi:acetyltransferase-like isoleucine patch superfamily enzyme
VTAPSLLTLRGFVVNLRGKDKWHIVRQGTAWIRGFLWSGFFRLLARRWSLGKHIRCYAWPRVTYVNGILNIGEAVKLDRVTLIVAPHADLGIGARTSVNEGTVIGAYVSVSIGADVLIAEHVTIRDYDHRFDRLDAPINRQGFKGAPVHIEDDVWICRGVAVLKGVRIGKGAVVGANAVVTSDVPPYAIVVGAPARIIGSRKS